MPKTLDDVAKIAGVSRSTVSRVINAHPNVSADTRSRVEHAMEKCGYRPNAVARSLATNKTNIIGIVVPESVTKLFTDPYFPLMLRGATEACNRNGYHLILSLFTASTDSDVMHDRIARSGYIEGVVLANSSLDEMLIPNLFKERIPFVNIGRHPDDRVNYI
ncbi:LacI family DNA-binding transcriptional regulator, partial [Candidatus Bipolaricaulota bacterium]|nr:LacI family DNA-binding transcriptional regulator [Candidatus Bipolaricaulota bacterium]